MVIALDTETELTRPGVLAPPLACMTAANDRGNAILIDWKQSGLAAYHALTGGQLIAGHFIAYDMATLAANYPELFPIIIEAYEQDRITDTIVRAKLIDTATGATTRGKSYALDATVMRCLHEHVSKDEDIRLTFGALRNTDLSLWSERHRHYALTDAAITLRLWQWQEQFPEYLRDQFRQSRSSFWLYLMTCWGVRTDFDAVERLRYEADSMREEKLARMRELGFLWPETRGPQNKMLRAQLQTRWGVKQCGKAGATNTKAVKEAVVRAYARLGKPVPMTDPSPTHPQGQVQISADACDESGDQDLEDFAAVEQLSSVLDRDVPALIQGVSLPIHPRINSLLETGRVSMSDPNLQNISRQMKGAISRVPDIRACIRPRPGNVFVSADYGALELCTLAQTCIRLLGWSTLADALNRGVDPHTEMASRIAGITYARACELKDAEDPEFDKIRQTCKVANFGFPGGLGAAAFVSFARKSYGVRLTEEEARDLKRIWLETWPEMRDYFRLIDQMVNGQGYIVQPFSERYRGNVHYTAACNTFFQGLGSDVAKDAGWRIMKACYLETWPASPLFGFRTVNFVHDEFVVEGPESGAHDAAEELSALMLDAAKLWLPDVKIKAPAKVSRVWSKKAKAVKVNGRHVPWEPTH